MKGKSCENKGFSFKLTSHHSEIMSATSILGELKFSEHQCLIKASRVHKSKSTLLGLVTSTVFPKVSIFTDLRKLWCYSDTHSRQTPNV